MIVESSVGKGSSFHVYIPISEEPANQQPQEDSKNRIATEGSERILVVDDDPLLKEAFEKFLAMPEFTGADLAKSVLKIKPSMPIIMCTGHSETVIVSLNTPN